MDTICTVFPRTVPPTVAHQPRAGCIRLVHVPEVIHFFSTRPHLWSIGGDNIYNLLSNRQLHIHDSLTDSDHIDNTVNPSLSNNHTNTSSPIIIALLNSINSLVSSINSTKHPRTDTSYLEQNRSQSFFCIVLCYYNVFLGDTIVYSNNLGDPPSKLSHLKLPYHI